MPRMHPLDNFWPPQNAGLPKILADDRRRWESRAGLDAGLQTLREQAEMTRLPHRDMYLELDKLVWSKNAWLDTFAAGPRKRPDHEIDTRRRELKVLEQAAEDYRRAASKAVA